MTYIHNYEFLYFKFIKIALNCFLINSMFFILIKPYHLTFIIKKKINLTIKVSSCCHLLTLIHILLMILLIFKYFMIILGPIPVFMILDKFFKLQFLNLLLIWVNYLFIQSNYRDFKLIRICTLLFVQYLSYLLIILYKFVIIAITTFQVLTKLYF